MKINFIAYEPEVQVKETQLKTFTTTSTITIRPSADDDYKDFSCQAKHRALPPDVPMRANIHLSVLCMLIFFYHNHKN